MIFSKCIFLNLKRAKTVFILCIFSIGSGAAFSQSSQAITEIITNYGGYFKSGIGAVNPVKPDTSHNLLAFTFNGTRYSTGINNTLLSSNGNSFQNTTFNRLPINVIAGSVNSNTKVGLGALYDGVLNGPSNPPPVNNILLYLTDGTQGLNLGTGIANLPAGLLDFDVESINPASIGDGVPDILITQIADPSSGTDQYSFLDAGNSIVGSQNGISFSGISPVANWVADFYEASTNPLTLAVGFTQTERPIRLWAADFSFFGISAANYQNIVKFRIQLNGNSDLAFIAYNSTSTIILPVTISSFKSAVQNKDIRLVWETQNEINASHFEIERSTNAIDFDKINSVTAAGNSSTVRRYDLWDRNLAAGIYFYRLKQVDIDGKVYYSNIIKEVISDKNQLYNIFPNPVKEAIYFTHPAADDLSVIKIFSNDGKMIQVADVQLNTTQTKIEVTNLLTGTYFIRYYGKNGLEATKQFLKL
jgi:hypothetical protein